MDNWKFILSVEDGKAMLEVVQVGNWEEKHIITEGDVAYCQAILQFFMTLRPETIRSIFND